MKTLFFLEGGMLFLGGGNSDCKLQLQIRAAYQHQKKKKERKKSVYGAQHSFFDTVSKCNMVTQAI